ncbi:hypothetical protein [Deinococcus radiotolerans]|uniref:SCP domain-containing protein n=1 Tax=Deinococcus radiotolerans TaxID=1309407 RepID=A0ABQ2FNG1_9DEIO|nr:hypothetical protein [Deinococcus radiotolerans]GGL11384.1 hypothetical protein GCM10010844_32590 [Deinococcus radiotolerans]
MRALTVGFPLALTLSLGLTSCNVPSTGAGTPPPPPAPTTPTPTPPGSFTTTITPATVTVTDLQEVKLTISVNWNGYGATLYHHVSIDPPLPYRFGAPGELFVDARGAASGPYRVRVVTQPEDGSVQYTSVSTLTVIPDPTDIRITPAALLQLQPGASGTVTLTYTLPAGTADRDARLSVSSPDPSLVTASLEGRTVTITAAPTAPEQGLIPVTVKIEAAGKTAEMRIPVEVGTVISQEYQRFNALRAQAGLTAHTLDLAGSMNCWLHGRYTVTLGRNEHTEDPAQPFATPEGQQCAERSGLIMGPNAAHTVNSTPAVDGLITAPFHALGLLQPDTTLVAIGRYAQVQGDPTLISRASAVGTSRVVAAGSTTLVSTFPAAGATVDLNQYHGGEWPNPLTSCDGYAPESTGLPLLVITHVRGDTTATGAALSVDGQDLEVCAYGSTQYVNTTDPPGRYSSGLVGAQEIGRSLLSGYGAVFLIPKVPLTPGKTYAARVTVNGQTVSWSFRVASTLRPLSQDATPPVRLSGHWVSVSPVVPAGSEGVGRCVKHCG